VRDELIRTSLTSGEQAIDTIDEYQSCDTGLRMIRIASALAEVGGPADFLHRSLCQRTILVDH
jgi:hypothetical protein